MSRCPNRFPLSLPLVVILIAASASASAGIELAAVSWGHYAMSGNGGESQSYAVGDSAASGFNESRNFFVFDLPVIEGQVVYAELRAYNPAVDPDGFNGYESPDPTETLALHEVATDVATLIEGGNGLTGIFDDLGTGTYYGSRVVSAADNGAFVTVPLVTDALLEIEAASGPFAIGGALTSLAGSPLQMLFAYSHVAPAVVLVLEIEIFADGFETGDWSRWSAP